MGQGRKAERPHVLVPATSVPHQLDGHGQRVWKAETPPSVVLVPATQLLVGAHGTGLVGRQGNRLMSLFCNHYSCRTSGWTWTRVGKAERAPCPCSNARVAAVDGMGQGRKAEQPHVPCPPTITVVTVGWTSGTRVGRQGAAHVLVPATITVAAPVGWIWDKVIRDYCAKQYSLDKPENIPRETPLDIIAVLDTTQSEEYIRKQQLILGYFAKEMDLSHSGSRMTILTDKRFRTLPGTVSLKPFVEDTSSSACAACSVTQFSLAVKLIGDNSVTQRGKIIGRLECGRTQLEVSEELGIAQSVISRLWQRFQDDGNVSRCYSTGRPRVTTPNEDRYLAVTAKRSGRSTASDLSRQLSSATGTTVSRQIVYRRLGHLGLYARRPVRCVPLTASHCRLRLAWSREHALWTPQQWSCVMFSDESRFSLQFDSRRTFIWRAPREHH
ncbi:hypothetical protein AVEN_243285-1 [Araneus ventricosus]|uniref:Transposase Tc1-like domain-containing protein n=1 Tax=Araneus ventricosus TaxID=182803 RepID=A0A4Y2Q4E8_ARAVE|nr:hypothetical protein AVEN_243285-1 [Araneus ventricosus]